jgi:hypothetical protein
MLAANNKPTSTVDLKLTGLPVLAAELSNEMGAALLQTALALTPYNATQRNAMRCDAMQCNAMHPKPRHPSLLTAAAAPL